jgi:hypothetical protein
MGGFPMVSLGTGWFQGRNNMVAGFPTVSLGAEVVLGRKRHCRWLSHCVIGCWSGLRASTGANEPAGGVHTTSFPLPPLPAVTHTPSPFLCHPLSPWAVWRACSRDVTMEQGGGGWVFLPPHSVLGLFKGHTAGMLPQNEAVGGFSHCLIWFWGCLMGDWEGMELNEVACGFHTASFAFWTIIPPQEGHVGCTMPHHQRPGPLLFPPPPLPFLSPSQVDGTMVGDNMGKSILPPSLNEGRGKVVGVGGGWQEKWTA